MKFKYFLPSLALVVVLLSCRQNESPSEWSLASPDNSVRLRIFRSDEGSLSYTVYRSEGSSVDTVIARSPLGLVTIGADLGTGLTFSSADSGRIDETYELVSGKRLKNKASGRELKLVFSATGGNALQLNFRAYNDGVAFQYVLPGDTGRVIVTGETTGFRFPAGGRKWAQPYDLVTQWTPAYEKYYLDGVPIGRVSPNPGGWCFPALFNAGKTWVLLTEAGPFNSHYGSHFYNADSTGLYTIRPPEKDEAYGRETTSEVNLPWSSPWRVIIVSGSHAGIVESNLVYHVSPGRAEGDFSWVKPGKAAWNWWSETDSPQNYGKMVKFIDYAAANGWPYFLVDANWNIMKGGDLEKLSSYAASKGVALWAWYNSGGVHNVVTEQPRDKMLDREVRRKEMQWLQKIGVKGIKVDFFQTDKTFAMEQYQGILSDAAEFGIMVNFHGCTIPRGWSRKWPNLLSMESVRGAETYLFGNDFPEKAPLHNVHLVFTRNVIGPMDYTPVTFTKAKHPHITTYGHELALSVVFESGIVHFADAVDSYKKMPSFVTDFMRNVPVIWDETKLLAGSPDNDALIARQSGTRWYVGYINGKAAGKDVSVDFSFLPEGNYSASLIADGGSDTEFLNESFSVTSKTQKTIKVRGNGGFVIELGN